MDSFRLTNSRYLSSKLCHRIHEIVPSFLPGFKILSDANNIRSNNFIPNFLKQDSALLSKAFLLLIASIILWTKELTDLNSQSWKFEAIFQFVGIHSSIKNASHDYVGNTIVILSSLLFTFTFSNSNWLHYVKRSKLAVPIVHN